ncbi:phosphate ABC transporter permease subunit PstC [Desulfomonile tiedjei]|uniref:Phosphate transport system permease protein n=1 Tax=Desulfomonile tiedjei (strain ATCC 49306 / DSM 6799 / DCB-1) TaxID=706587 RepID=I4C9F6_DESTA|nr:phosphate ABC transporter permease subunit PstC [Desulfomonile tiedjei]AFM26197.1 phosphate ABC transporter membrane protein 1, PhoT family [Desulfomonile tiedjei DSM 6799]
MLGRHLVRVIVDEESISSPPTKAEMWSDTGFHYLTWGCTAAVILLLFIILWEIGGKAIPAMREYGLSFLVNTTWDANKAHFGILPHIWGTLYSSLLALLIGGFAGIVIAIFLTQDFMPPTLQVVFKNIIELLAAIPSVVYGLWGIFVLIPLVRPVTDFLYDKLNWIPFFSTSLAGPGMLPAALVLAIMILPTVAAISQDSLLAIPHKVKEAAYGMGTTRWQAILRVMLPTASHGIFGALVLGLGRALGETMALAMLVGNSNQISLSLFSPANTLAALLALNFPEAGTVETQALMYAAIVLLVITLVVNVIGQAIITLTSQHRS